MQHFQSERAAAERVGCSETADGLKPRGPRPQRRPRCERRRHPWRRRLCLFSRVPCQRPTSIRQRGGPVYVGYKQQQPQTASSCFEATPVAVAARGGALVRGQARRSARSGLTWRPSRGSYGNLTLVWRALKKEASRLNSLSLKQPRRRPLASELLH